jgi:hypothetical protein
VSVSATDYPHLTYEYQAHHIRFRQFVESRRPQLVCQDCRGRGGWRDVICDDGTGPWEPCGWCEGTGLVTPHLRGEWLRLRKDEIRRAAWKEGK